MRWWSIAGVVVMLGCGGGDDGGGPDAGPDGGPSSDDFAAACARIGSCVGGGASLCFDRVLPGALDDVACVNAAGVDCDAIRACLGYQRMLDPACNPGMPRRCDGGMLIECIDGVRTAIDCADYFQPVGPTCVMSPIRADCGGETCTVEGERTCSGTLLSECDSGITEVFDCARLGATCAPSGTGVARCNLTTGATCTVGAPERCDGRSRVTCEDDGLEARLDRALLVPGWTCVGSGATTACRFGDACTADDSGAADSCAGTTLRFCAGGVPGEIDCTTLGFAGCTAAGGRAACL